MKTGQVKFYNLGKGYGFIIDDDTNEEVFVHASGLNQDVRLRENDRVTFNVKDGKKGLNAINVEKV